MEPFAFLDRYLADFRKHLARETLLEAIGIFSISALSIFAVSVAIVAGWPAVAFVRWCGATLGAFVLLMLLRMGFRTHRVLSDQVGLSRLLSERIPGLGLGLAAVMSLRPRLAVEGTPDFSPALLHAEAMRDIRILADHPPADLVGYPRVVRLVISMGVLVGALALLALFFPSGVARGVRDLLGLSDRFTPSWLIGPPIPTDFLAYDIRTAVLVPRPDGSFDRVPGDETGEITAPEGALVEVSGRLTTAATSGTAVLTTADSETTSPLEITPDGGFTATLRVTRPGTWHVSVRTPSAGIRVEVARRRVMIAAIAPPVVTVVPPARWALKPGESAVVSYTAEATTGLAGIDAVYRYPLDPDRPLSRVHLRDLAPGTRRATGEVSFTMPADVSEPTARVDLVIEAFARIPAGKAGTGSSEVISFSLDQPRPRYLALVDTTERLLSVVLDALALALEGQTPPPDRLVALGELARRIATDARTAAPGIAAAADEAANVLGGAGGKNATDALERAAFALDRAVGRERRLVLLSLALDLSREAARLRAPPPTPDRGAVAERTLARARRLLRLVEVGHRQLLGASGDLTGARRVETARLGDMWSRATDALSAAEEAARAGAPDAAQVLGRAASALEEVAVASRLGHEGEVADRGVEVGPEVVAMIRQAMNAEREVMDRTAQAAFDIKQKADALAAERAPDAGRLRALADEAGSAFEKVAADRLDAPDAAELAAIRENAAVVRDLLGGRDFDTAHRVLRELVDRAAMLAAQVRDQAEWLEDDPARDPGAMRVQAGRISRATAPLREVLRALAAWKREREAALGPAERERLRVLKAEQDRVLAIGNRLVEALKAAAGGADAPPAALAARRNMDEASRRLAEFQANAAEAHQRQAIQDLLRLRRSIEARAVDDATASRPRLAASQEERVEVRLPEPGGPRAPDSLRREVLSHATEPAAEGFADLVRAYYEALVRP